MRIARSRVIGPMIAIALTIVGCSAGAGGSLEVEPESAALTGPTAVSNVVPSGLVQSTGNLYWTANGRTVFPRQYWARVYRTGKYDAPGSETILYSESSLLPVSFGDITWAYVGGNYYGYFAANYETGSYIKRVSLSGGSATVFVTTSGPIGRTLANDGTYLWWADNTGLYQTVLLTGVTTQLYAISGITSVTFDRYYVYFSVAHTIFKYLRSTGMTYFVATPPYSVKAIAVFPGVQIDDSDFWWADDRDTYTPIADLIEIDYKGDTYIWGTMPDGDTITSLSWSGYHVLWTYCTTSGTNCQAAYRTDIYTGFGTAVGDGANFIQGDSSAFFYGTKSGVFRVDY